MFVDYVSNLSEEKNNLSILSLGGLSGTKSPLRRHAGTKVGCSLNSLLAKEENWMNKLVETATR